MSGDVGRRSRAEHTSSSRRIDDPVRRRANAAREQRPSRSNVGDDTTSPDHESFSREQSPSRRIDDPVRRRANSAREQKPSHSNVGDDTISQDHESSSREQSPDPNTPYPWNFGQRELTHTQAVERGRAKMERYQQEAKYYQNKYKDIFEKFQKTYETVIFKDKFNKGVFSVESKDWSRTAEYKNSIDIGKGQIIGNSNSKENTNDLHFSDVAYIQLQLALQKAGKDISQFNLKSWYGKKIRNVNTKNVVKLFFPEEIGEDGLVKGGKKTFKAGSDEFTALAGTETAQSKFYLLAQHPEAFPGKRVTSITVIRHPNKEIDIEYKFGSVTS